MSPTAVADYPSYDRVEDLLRDLRAQNFILEEISEGWRIRSPYSERTTIAHRNNVHSAKIADLKQMGFFPPGVVKKLKACSECGQRFMGVQKVTQHRIDDHGYRLTCKVCGKTGFMSVSELSTHTGREHPEKTKRGRARLAAQQTETAHEAVAAETKQIKEAAAAKTARADVAKPKLKGRKRAPVRKGYVEEIAHFMELIDKVKADMDEVVDAYKELYKLHQQDKKRIAEIEQAAERLVSKF